MKPGPVRNASNPEGQPAAEAGWFCLQTHSKHEHIAGHWLRHYYGIETYAPRIRFRRPQNRGPVWFTEALFPNYLFARFELAGWLQKVGSAPGIRRIVRFGAHYPLVPREIIDGLRATVGEDVHTIEDALNPGEVVQVAGGPFNGLRAVVTRAMPGNRRVDLLLDFLGRQAMVGVPRGYVVPVENARHRVFEQVQSQFTPSTPGPVR
jgi:transcriptional antiterminator RfaH